MMYSSNYIQILPTIAAIVAVVATSRRLATAVAGAPSVDAVPSVGVVTVALSQHGVGMNPVQGSGA